MEDQLNVLSLREQVYRYLRKQMAMGALTPGTTVNIGKIAEQLGISKTPLRDALIHLEVEGFVTILPRRGVRVNVMTLDDVRHAYDAAGMVEGAIVRDCFDKITPSHIDRLERLNEQMIRDIKKDDFTTLFETNLEFHDVYIELSDNRLLKKFIRPIKHRLYDFPRQNYIQAWELRNCREHDDFITELKSGDPRKAAQVLKGVHWSFEVQKQFIQQFYGLEG
jgi:DNA-binding GntR family transcriptional regulator